MNTSKIADISEIVSSVAIVITLVFLALEMQQNTRAIEASTRQAALGGDTQFLMEALSNPEIIIAWTKPELTDVEVLQHFYSLVLFVRYHESSWAQYQRGILDEATWLRYRKSISEVFQYERNRIWWRNYGQLTFESDFVAEVNALLETEPVNRNRLPDELRTFITPTN